MYESLFKNPLHRVFVYGTLKRGEPNHRVIQSNPDGYAKFLGLGKTVKKYPLVIATKYNIPFLLKKPGTGNVSLWRVSGGISRFPISGAQMFWLSSTVEKNEN